MSLLFQLIAGLLAGYLAARVMNVKGGDFILYLILGMAGAWVGGWIFKLLGIIFWGLLGTIFSAIIGAVIVILIIRLFR